MSKVNETPRAPLDCVFLEKSRCTSKLGLEKGEIHGIPDWFGLEDTFKTISFPGWNIPWKGNFHELRVLQVPLLPSESLAQRLIPSLPHSMDVSTLQENPTLLTGLMQLPKDSLEFLFAPSHPPRAELEENLTLGIISHPSQLDQCPSG